MRHPPAAASGTERHRDTEGHKDTETHKNTERQRKTERQRDRETKRQRGRETERQRDKEATRQRDEETEQQRERKKERKREDLRAGWPEATQNLARLCRENSERRSEEPPQNSANFRGLPGRAKRQELAPRRKDRDGRSCSLQWLSGAREMRPRGAACAAAWRAQQSHWSLRARQSRQGHATKLRAKQQKSESMTRTAGSGSQQTWELCKQSNEA